MAPKQKRKSEQLSETADGSKRGEEVNIELEKKKKKKSARQDPEQERKASEKSAVADAGSAKVISDEDGGAKAIQAEKNQQQERKSRYILYVTNIPYDASKEDIVKHFGILKDKLVSIRMLTDKGTGQFRGTCFIDCADKESFAVALKLHHTKLLDRKIVVEPTVGGGGKGENRMQRLNKKREKFSEVRKKRMRKGKAQKEKQKKAGGGGGSGGGGGGESRHSGSA